MKIRFVECSFKNIPCVLDRDKAVEMLLSYNSFQSFAWNKLFRKSLFENISFPVGQTYEDIMPTYKLLCCSKKVSIVSETLYYYYQHNESITRSKENYENYRDFTCYYENKKRNDLALKEFSYLSEVIGRNTFWNNRVHLKKALKYPKENKQFISKCKKERKKEMKCRLSDFLKSEELSIYVKCTTIVMLYMPSWCFGIYRNIRDKQ